MRLPPAAAGLNLNFKSRAAASAFKPPDSFQWRLRVMLAALTRIGQAVQVAEHP